MVVLLDGRVLRLHRRTGLARDWLDNAVERGFINDPYLSNHDKILRTLDGNARFGELLSRVRTAWEQFEP